MYTIILDEGVVIKNDGMVQVAPCQSELDQEFTSYITWVNMGNQPTIINTRSDLNS